MNERIAQVLSFLLHPLLIPSYLLATLFWFDPSYSVLLPAIMKLLVAGTLLITTLFIPLLILLILRRMKLISSFYLVSREERIFPLIALAIFYYLSFYLLKDLYLPRQFQVFMLGATLLTVIILLISLGYRISLHMAGWGAAAGLFFGMCLSQGTASLTLLITAILLSGITGSARMKLNAHHPAEIYTGWLTGVVVMFTMTLVL